MFEQVLEARNIKVSVYNSPALPLGSDISGIIHIHGNVSDPKYMVVTDEDFGKAYLTEGYASRFLTKLFESYTVLFVGYSYNDTILRYENDQAQIPVRPIHTKTDYLGWKGFYLCRVF